MADEFALKLNNPLTEEDWDIITDADLDNTPRVMFHTKHGKDVEYVKVKHGRWVEDEYGIPHCSECKAINNTVYRNYCPNCGAKMDLIGEDKSHPFAESVMMGMDGGEE